MAVQSTPVSTSDAKSSIRSHETVSKRLHQLELKYNLYQYEIDGWCVWALLRISVGNALLNLPWKNSDKYYTGRLSKGELLAIAIKDIPVLIWPRKVRYVVKTYNGNLRELENSLYKNIFFDDLLLDIGLDNCFKIESLNTRANARVFLTRSRMALVKSDGTLTLFELLAGLLATAGIPGRIQKIAQPLSACLQQEPGFEVFTSGWIARRLRYFYWYKKLYSGLFGRIKPEYLLMINSMQYAVIAAAKEQGVQVIEFQHGSPNRHKIPYSWPAEAVPYKSKIPIADQLFLYGEYFEHELRAGGFWDEELCSVGSLRIDQYRRHSVGQRTDSGQNLCTILVTTQGVDVEQLIAFMAEFLRLAEGMLKLCVYFKLHQNFSHGKALYEAAFGTDPNVQVLLNTDPPSTFELFTQADFHLSIYSTTHYEAIGLGVPTIVLPFSNHELMLHLYEAGHAFLVQTPQDLLDYIIQHQGYKIPDEISEFYFRPNALENMRVALEE